VAAILILLLVGWGAGELSWSFLQARDLDVVRDIAARRTPILTGSALAVSLAGSVLVICPLAMACCALLYRGGRRAAAMLLALSVGGAGLIFTVEKLIVGRPRPAVTQLVAASHSSFPSGHATLASAFYLALMIVFLTAAPRRPAAVTGAIAAGLLVIGIGLSRVYLGVHYPSDVAGGVLLGATWTLLVARSLRHCVRGRPVPRDPSTIAGAVRVPPFPHRGAAVEEAARP
jgi:undecaprenyl-diphosphatase